ncbi:MAG: hypothetical protein LBR30_03000 [Clostridioides sp.]|nr:hypothetical protein [Clostridioides sp.]
MKKNSSNGKIGKRIFKIVLKIVCVLFLAMIAVFLISTFKTNYDKAFLNKLQGNILYMRRDKDEILTIYKSKFNTQNEEVLVTRKGQYADDTNNNIVDMVYSADKNKIFYIGFLKDGFKLFEFDLNDETTKMLPDMEKKSVYELYLLPSKNTLVYSTIGDETDNYYSYDLDKNTTTLIDPSGSEWDKEYDDLKKILTYETDSITSENGKYTVTYDKGNLYLKDNTTKESKLLRKFYGTYDYKFLPGYCPSQIIDNKYLVYDKPKHLTAIGQLLEGILFQRTAYTTEIVDLETGETSQYIDGASDIYLLK